MTPSGQTLCLCMIVKDEAHVIRRCLASVRPIVDHWIVVDTGSRDGTQEIVREAMAGLPGEVVERPWVDFAHNRSEALALARPHADYSLIIDADDELVLPPGFAMPDLDADSCTLDIHYGGSTYRRPQFVRNALAWRYRGVLHEFLDCPDATTGGHVPIVMRINKEGRRSTDPDLYARDAAILERALTEETDPFLVARYTFYLAQSYRDCGRREPALAAYLRRAELGYWDEEVFVSLYQAGNLMQALGRAPEAVIDTYARASATCPSRAEAAHAASRFCRNLSRYQQGYDIARPAIGLTAPPAGLFVETWIYEYGLLDEYAVNAYWAGRYRDCLDAALRALEGGKVPAAERPRFRANMRFALDRLPQEAPAPAVADEAVSPAETAPSPATPRLPVPTRMNLGSGKDFRADCLNIDVDASWSPDAVVDLSAVRLGPEGVALETQRFGKVTLRPGTLDAVMANDVLEHVPDLVALMTTCLGLLRVGGVFEISVPYDLSYGAWQDPTHVRTFNERSWLYYTDWFWYLGWREARFTVASTTHVPSPEGAALRDAGTPWDEILRRPRAIDAMQVVLRKIDLTPTDRETLAYWRDRRREAAIANRIAAPEREQGDRPPEPFAGSWEEARDRYCLWLVSPHDYAHHPGLRDAAQAVSDAFAALGGSAPLVADPSAWDGRTPIVFGGHLLGRHPAVVLPPDAIIMNLEPVDAESPWLGEAYLTLLKRHPVLDYSIRNLRALQEAGIGHARHFPIRSMPRTDADGDAETGNAAARDIDVLFYGSINARRRHILDGLRERGLQVVELFGVYGDERDAAVARAKVVVNIHYYEAAIFEAIRISHLLALGACVVSEGRPDDPDCTDLAEGLELCAYDDIVERCHALVGNAERRADLSRAARASIAARPQSAILQAAFPRAA